MTQSARHQHRSPQHLTTSRGAALYIGALLGPGLLLLPGLAAAEAGPASILAWLALLALSGLFAAVFSALGRNFPSAGGVMGYVAAGLGERIGLVAAWSFLAAVVGGAPIVCLIGASYVTRFAGGGQLARAAVAAVLLLIVLALAAVGLRASAGAQLILVSLLISVVAVAIAGSGASSRAANWSPFAPHGWPSVGHAAATLMLSFVGWEAVAPLTPRFADPARQLPRVVGIALAVTTALYLGLAIATTSVLGPAAATTVPLADLLRHAIGPAGPAAAAAAAVVLTLGTTNAYVNGAATMARQLTRSPAAPPRGQRPAPRGHGPAPAGHGPALAGHGPAPRGHGPALAGHGPAPRGHGPALASHGPAPRFLAAIAVAGLLLLTLYGLRLVSTASLVAVPTALFLSVYLASMAAAARLLRGPARTAAVPAALAVIVMLAYCGWALVIPVIVALAGGWHYQRSHIRVPDQAGGRQPACAQAVVAEGSLAAVGSSPRGWPSRYRPDSSGEGTVSALESSRWE